MRRACPGLRRRARTGLEDWLAAEATNTYGGIYTWTDRAAMETFTSSDLFKSVAANPNFANITSRDFAVLAGPTAITQARIPAAA